MFENTLSARRTKEFARIKIAATAVGVARSSATGALLNWAEHCTECAMPACFVTCEFYTPREDFKCRRFHKPVQPTHLDDRGVYWREITFRKWGKLEATGTANVVRSNRFALETKVEAIVNWLVRNAPGTHGFRVRLNFKWNAYKQAILKGIVAGKSMPPQRFNAEFYNPSEEIRHLMLTFRQVANPTHQHQERLELSPGYNFVSLDVKEFFAQAPSDAAYIVSLSLDSDNSGIKLLLGGIDFSADPSAVQTELAIASNSAAKTVIKMVKCVVWDLDNTLWRGTLVEDGIDGIELRTDIVEVIKELDNRGILHSIASKNNYSEAIEALKKFQLDQYFLYPQVSWNPKSQSIASIVESLNIGIDTILFIDDQDFERAEVSFRYPKIVVLDEKEAIDLPAYERCNVPVTVEGLKRRQLYRDQVVRDEVKRTFGDGYISFLLSCDIVVDITPITADRINRVHELAQRTNQMNFSGNRYSKQNLLAIEADPAKRTYVVSCRDKFGEYGIIGFGVVDIHDWLLEDLMFSCRIQAKKVEHHLLEHIANEAVTSGASAFRARYRKTDRNAPSGKVFDDLGFVEIGRDGDFLLLELALDGFEPKHTIIQMNSWYDRPRDAGVLENVNVA